MTRQFLVRQGEDESPEFDLTDATSPVHVIWEEMEVGGRAFRGESDAGIIPTRDERGETGNPFDLPSGLDFISLSRGSTWEWLENVGDADEVVMARGRIGPKDYSRGRQKADRAREVGITVTDPNEHLQLIIVDDWVRPSETDVARVEALRLAYLQGDPRPTTVLAGTYISSDNPVTLEAQTYDGSSPHEVLQDVALKANKNFFVTVDNELWYDSWDSTAYPAGVRISDRQDEWSTDGTCADGGDAFLGSAASNSGTSFFSDHPAWAGLEEERVELPVSQGVPAGATIIVRGAWNATVAKTITVYDEQGNTWTKDAEHENTASSGDDIIEFWRCNVTNSLSAGDYIRYAAQVTGSPWNARAINAWSFAESLSVDTVGTGAGTIGGSASITAPAGDVVLAGLSIFCDIDEVAITPDGDWSGDDEVGTTGASSSASKTMFVQNLTDQASTNNWTVGMSPNRDWAALAVSYSRDSASGSGLPTFGPIWDVGAASSEDGLDLRCGMRLYYGEEGAYVYLHNDTVHDEYWHAEESVYTSDPTITDATKAMALLEAMYERRKEEERTYNVSIGPLNESQVPCIKYGQLIYIKARPIPDADDAFMPRRIAQLRWTTPRPGVFFARMQLSRPRKQEPYSVGPKDAVQATTKHATAGTHPAGNITIIDSGGYYSGNDVEAALQEIGADLGGGIVTDHGSLTGLTDDDHPQYLTDTGGEKHTLNTVAASGSTETLNLAGGNLHDVTLTDDCTFTFAGATNGVGCYLTLILRQDGTGGHAVTWPASVEWPGGNEPDLSTDADAVDVLSFLSDDGGTTWFGTAGGSGGGGGAAGRWELVMSPGVTSPPVPVENPDGDDWVYIFVED